MQQSWQNTMNDPMKHVHSSIQYVLRSMWDHLLHNPNKAVSALIKTSKIGYTQINIA